MSPRVLLMAGSMEEGGSEQQTLLLLQHLDRSRVTPELFLTYRRGSLLGELPADVPVHAFDDAPFSPLVNWPGRWHSRMVRFLRELIARRQIDVVYDRTFHMTLIAAPACGNRVPRVATIVSPPDRDLPHSELRFLAAKQRRLSAGYRAAAQVLAVSEQTRQSAVQYYCLPEEKVATLYSPVDLSRLESQAELPLPATDWQTTLEADARVNIACIGRFTPEKGQDVLVEAIAQLVDELPELAERIVVWMVGQGPGQAAIVQQIQRRGLMAHFQFVGRQRPVAPLLARCDMLVSPSRYEGLSNVILEAFALRVPVVATDAGGTRELVKPGTGWLVPVEQPSALAAGIVAVVSDPQAAALRAEAARRQVETNHLMADYVRCVEDYLLAAAS